MKALARKLVAMLPRELQNRIHYRNFPYYCPVCEIPILQWVPFGRGVGDGQIRVEPELRLCPNCGSFERTRHFVLWLKKFKTLEGTPRFLHFAPERVFTEKLREALGTNYVTNDLFMENVDRHEDITAMSFGDDSFDFIYCSNVLEHVEDDANAMKELYRVLAPGGTAIIQVPIEGETTYEDPAITDPVERTKHFGQEDHVRYYGRDIQERLSSAGFQVREFTMLDELKLSEKDIVRMNLDKEELIYECTKTS